jgi:hypothetical protein
MTVCILLRNRPIDSQVRHPGGGAGGDPGVDMAASQTTPQEGHHSWLRPPSLSVRPPLGTVPPV